MSADLRDFAAAFNQSYQHAATSAINAADKAQQRAIQVERNKIIDKHNAANARRDDIKLGLYAETVRNAGVLAQARAQAIMNKGSGKGGGGGGGGGGGPSIVSDLEQGASTVGLSVPKPPATQPINVNVMGGSGVESPDPVVSEPPVGSTVITERQGGMVPKMANGGLVGDMSLGQAESYETREKADSATPKNAVDAFNSGVSSGAAAATKDKDKDKGTNTTKPTTPQPATRPPTALVPNVSPDLTGTGETYRRGGAVRRFQSGGRVMEAIDTGMSGPGSGFGHRAAPPSVRR